MKVKELIVLLQGVDPEKPVVLCVVDSIDGQQASGSPTGSIAVAGFSTWDSVIIEQLA